jgi:hypothetical protein
MRGGRLIAIRDAPPEDKPSEQELVALMLGVGVTEVDAVLRQ